MTGLLKRRRYPTRGSLYFLLFILAGTAATTLPEAARANDVAIDAIINHPAVAVARARVCQSARSGWSSSAVRKHWPVRRR